MFVVCSTKAKLAVAGSRQASKLAALTRRRITALEGAGMTGNESWQRRHAVQIVAQLPEDAKDALRVLELARELVETFLQDRPCQPFGREPVVVAFPEAAPSR